MPATADAIVTRLDSTWTRWWTMSLLSGLALAAAGSFGILLVCVLVDALFRLPQRGLALGFLAWAVGTLMLLAMTLRRLLGHRRTLAGMARRIELDCPELESHLINLVQFSERDSLDADPFRSAAIAQAAATIGDHSFNDAAARHTRWSRFRLGMQTSRDLAEAIALLVAVLLLGGVLHLGLPAWAFSTRRLLHPWTFVPAVGAVRISQVDPGQTAVLVGSPLEVKAQVAVAPARAHAATLWITRPDGTETALAMAADSTRQTYSATIPQVASPLSYRLEVGDTQTTRFRVGIYERPTVQSVAIIYTYPDYLEHEPETRSQPHGDLEAPQLTHAALRIQPSAPVAQAHLLLGNTRIPARVADGGRVVLADLLLRETATYTIHLETAQGRGDPSPRVNQVKITPDVAPRIELVEPRAESSAAEGAKVAVVLRAGDDHALGLARIECRRGGADHAAEAPRTLAEWTTFPNPTDAVLHHEIVLGPDRVKPGETLLVRAVARDRRAVNLPDLKLDPQESATPWHAIQVQSQQEKHAAEVADLDTLRSTLAAILQEQLRLRVATVRLRPATSLAAITPQALKLKEGQTAIQQQASAVLDKLASAPATEPDRQVVARVVGKLAHDEMVQAVQQAGAVAAAAEVPGAVAALEPLGQTQDRIIDVLRRLLNEVRQDAAELRAELDSREDTQLPPDVQQKLQQLDTRLQEFLKQQRKVIEATDQLAKKPVEDFSDAEAKLLAELAAIEDDWSRFLADQHSDFSKLPEQDFANPSLLQEMIAVQNELKMARDALTSKTADIAVPLEQLGAEMAKEMTTNIEKWLPDTPDRERWSQEEPLTDDMKEAPMAELPQELEDIVGELMEDEQDLFDEMEDITSSWADSLDKGAGWDALDGPISNMSARGVTGNRLPNTSEIGGRSGEGRSGKSSGEFVGDTAVGKGGRKTPSRLSADAFVKGQIKDTSKDPVGGATGGGKSSGLGGEGLQGPVPDRPQRVLERLATRQAELRNRAEGVDLKFQVLRYQHNDLKKLLAQMAAVEQDLRGGLYQNALRRRSVLVEGLDRVRMQLKGEFLIRQDQTANLPTDLQKDLLGSMQEPAPAGWEDLNRQYYERLSGSPVSVPATRPETRP